MGHATWHWRSVQLLNPCPSWRAARVRWPASEKQFRLGWCVVCVTNPRDSGCSVQGTWFYGLLLLRKFDRRIFRTSSLLAGVGQRHLEEVSLCRLGEGVWLTVYAWQSRSVCIGHKACVLHRPVHGHGKVCTFGFALCSVESASGAEYGCLGFNAIDTPVPYFRSTSVVYSSRGGSWGNLGCLPCVGERWYWPKLVPLLSIVSSNKSGKVAQICYRDQKDTRTSLLKKKIAASELHWQQCRGRGARPLQLCTWWGRQLAVRAEFLQTTLQESVLFLCKMCWPRYWLWKIGSFCGCATASFGNVCWIAQEFTCVKQLVQAFVDPLRSCFNFEHGNKILESRHAGIIQRLQRIVCLGCVQSFVEFTAKNFYLAAKQPQQPAYIFCNAR